MYSFDADYIVRLSMLVVTKKNTYQGRVLIDTAKSFVYTEGGLKGVLMASRLSGLSPNLTSRFSLQGDAHLKL